MGVQEGSEPRVGKLGQQRPNAYREWQHFQWTIAPFFSYRGWGKRDGVVGMSPLRSIHTEKFHPRGDY